MTGVVTAVQRTETGALLVTVDLGARSPVGFELGARVAVVAKGAGAVAPRREVRR